MTGSVLRFEKLIDLPREIVWDALVDSDLVSGWLAEADIEPRVGGRFDLAWTQFRPAVHTEGEIVELVEAQQLVVDTSNFGRTTFTLHEAPGGPRLRSTVLVVTVDAIAEKLFSSMICATWTVSLEQLVPLLHGHPVVWATWSIDSGGEWVAIAAQRK